MSMSLALQPKLDRIVHASQTAQNDPFGRKDVQYVHSVLAQVSFPRKAVQGTEFERKSGKVSVSITAGKLWDRTQWVPQPIPYGAMPRLILAYCNARAIKTKQREIKVGESASDFLRCLGYASTSGGKRGVMTSFTAQTKALAACRISLGFGRQTINETVFRSFNALEGEKLVWPETLEFSVDYFDSLITHATPIPMVALQAVRGSALGIDILSWLTHRLRRVEPGEGDHISWESLKEQFGDEYTDSGIGMRNFRTEFLRLLNEIKMVYSAARVTPVIHGRNHSGLLLQRSEPLTDKSVR